VLNWLNITDWGGYINDRVNWFLGNNADPAQCRTVLPYWGVNATCSATTLVLINTSIITTLEAITCQTDNSFITQFVNIIQRPPEHNPVHDVRHWSHHLHATWDRELGVGVVFDIGRALPAILHDHDMPADHSRFPDAHLESKEKEKEHFIGIRRHVDFRAVARQMCVKQARRVRINVCVFILNAGLYDIQPSELFDLLNHLDFVFHWSDGQEVHKWHLE